MTTTSVELVHAGSPVALSLRARTAPRTGVAHDIRYWLVLSATLVRIPMAALLTVTIVADSVGLSWALIVLYVLTDIADGQIARTFDCDDALRRAVDVIIDRVSIHVFLLACCLMLGTGWIVFAGLLLRDLAHGLYSARLLQARNLVVVGAKWHSIYGLSIAAYVAYAISVESIRTAAEVVVILIGAAVLVDYVRRASLEARHYLAESREIRPHGVRCEARP